MTPTLTRTLGRLILLTCLLAGLLLPRSGAVLAEVAGFERVVICQGDRLVIVALDAGGTPVEIAIEEHGPCTLTDARADAGPMTQPWWALSSVRLPPPVRFAALAPRPFWHGPPPERGPPSAA